MKTRNKIKTICLSLIITAATITTNAQGVKTMPGDDEPPIGVSNWGYGAVEKTVCAVGEIFVRDDAYWDTGYSGDWICNLLPCPEDETPTPDPTPPPADTSGAGGNTGGDGGGNTPPKDDDKDDKDDKDEKSTSQSQITKYASTSSVGKSFIFKIAPNQKEDVKKYMKSRAKMTHWVKEGFYYTYYSKGTQKGKKYFNFYITDQRPNANRPVPALRYVLTMNNGAITFSPDLGKNFIRKGGTTQKNKSGKGKRNKSGNKNGNAKRNKK